jgi:hypothetical protein
MTTAQQNKPTSSVWRVKALVDRGKSGDVKRPAAAFELDTAMDGAVAVGPLFPSTFCTALIWLAGRGALA